MHYLRCFFVIRQDISIFIFPKYSLLKKSSFMTKSHFTKGALDKKLVSSLE
jgi:hypothetical protein